MCCGLPQTLSQAWPIITYAGWRHTTPKNASPQSGTPGVLGSSH